MTSDPLHDLLHRTDAATTTPALPDDDLAARIRHVAKRRRVVRAGTAAVVLAAMAIVTSAFVWPRLPRQRTEIAQSAPDPVRLRAELMALRSDADARLAAVEIVLDRERKQQQAEKLRQALNRPDALERVHREQDRAALILICQADRIYNDPRRRQSAAEEYRQLLALFPQTQWAAVARQRLAEIGI